LDANGFEFIDKLEQLLLRADELRACLSTAAIVIGQVAYRLEVLGSWGDISRSAFSAIGKYGALMKFATTAMAGGFATLSAQGVEGARQDRIALEAVFKQAWQELLGLAKLRAKGAELLIHDGSRGKGAGILYITIV
jgi:hypothetical protein